MHAPVPAPAPSATAPVGVAVPSPRADAAPDRNDFATIHSAMVERLRAVTAPRIAVFPLPGEFEDVREYIAAVSRIMDAWLYRVGMEVKSNTHGLDMEVFTDQFRGATEGNCEYECTKAADRQREEFYAQRRR